MTDSDADIVTVGKPIPRIASATPLEFRKVKITWKEGGTKTIDLAAALASRRIFIPLRTNDRLFKTLRVSEYGDALEWEGPDLEFPASWLDRLPDAEFSNAQFRDAMNLLGMSNEGMAAALQISRSQVAEYKKDKPIPQHVALATRYLVEHLAA